MSSGTRVSYSSFANALLWIFKIVNAPSYRVGRRSQAAWICMVMIDDILIKMSKIDLLILNSAIGDRMVSIASTIQFETKTNIKDFKQSPYCLSVLYVPKE